MLGVRMPRRPPYPSTQGLSLMKRIGAVFTDGRTWTTLFYMLLMLPLGIIYFTVTVTLLSLSLGFIGAPFAKLILADQFMHVGECTGVPEWVCNGGGWPGAIAVCLLGVVLLFATLHLLRGLGKLHGQVAKHLLVRSVSN
jgi:Putative sensor